MTTYRLLHYLIAFIWLINGLICKVLNGVPRHREIVARILGGEHAALFTKAIGFAEIAMAIWIVSGIKTRLNALTQAAVIATMNVLEFVLVPDLLLWGRWNTLFAFMFICIILSNEFFLKNKVNRLM